MVNPATDMFNTLLSCSAVTVGNFPTGGLAPGSDGNFYGTTEVSVFEVSTNGTAIDSSFLPGGEGGFNPQGVLLPASNGSFYGTTEGGGAFNEGTVFEFTASGGFTTLYSFGGVTNWDGSIVDGIMPIAGLTAGPDGSLYGSTFSGGYEDSGTIFKITTNGVFTTVAWLGGSNGAGPGAPLALGADGNLYGTTQNGGPNDAGTIFELIILPPPRIQSVSTVGGMINMAWSVTAGQSYQLQFSADLSQGNWTDLGGPAVATGAQLIVTDSLAHSQRFYRLAQILAP